ncbi:MAG: GNAT family N-acetyltransferase [Lachnospiraceae bacterium]|nr:GNAT family N-acetyltransferase [Lachnospiraceae bacterium]
MNIEEMARAQFRLDTNCSEECENNYRIMINPSKRLSGARIFEGMSDDFRAVIFKGDAYIMASERLMEWTKKSYEKYKPEWFCEFGNLRRLDKKLMESGLKIHDTHIYFLPDEYAEEYELECPYEVRWYEDDAVKEVTDHKVFPHALPESKTQPDRLAVAAFDEGRPIAVAGASDDGKYMWQIGIDVLPEYEHHGLAVFLVDSLKKKILEKGILPYYGTSESHSLSQDVAIRSGFLPAWAEIFVKKIEKT